MSARHPKPPKYRTDWFRVFVDLQRNGYLIPDIAEALDVPLSTAKTWKYRSEPGHECGRLLLQLWCNATGKTEAERPQTLA